MTQNRFEKLDSFMRRMTKLGIKVDIISNVPWIYISKVNGNRIKPEDYFLGNHGFTIGFHPLKKDNFDFSDITKIFNLIRKYK